MDYLSNFINLAHNLRIFLKLESGRQPQGDSPLRIRKSKEKIRIKPKEVKTLRRKEQKMYGLRRDLKTNPFYRSLG